MEEIVLKTKHIQKDKQDILHHLAIDTTSNNLVEMFGDVKFVCMGGSPRRMEKFARFMAKELEMINIDFDNLAKATDRYALYKVGPVLISSHGMGMPSISIVLHEIIKLLYHSGCTKDVLFFRIGTCGGLDIVPGTVIISESAVDGQFRQQYDLAILGKIVSRPTSLDGELADELMSCWKEMDKLNFSCIKAKTMCTLDFYEGQARLDGAFCDYDEEDKMQFLKRALQEGVRNIEMESLCFAAICRHANVKAAVVCVALLNRLNGDQIFTDKETLKEWENRPMYIISRCIKNRLAGI